MPWGAAIAAVGAVAGGVIASKGSKSAAQTQANATQAGIDEQQRQFDLNREDSAPYRQAGAQALGQLQTEINQPVTAADVMADPGYKFGLDQGQRALSQRVAAGGGRISGAALKAASRFGTDYATTGYGAAYQRRQDRLNRLAAIAGIGQTSTAASAASGSNAANAISQMVTSQGDATAAGQVARGSIWGNAANQLAALAQRQFTPGAGGYGPGGSQGYFNQWGTGGGYGSGTGGMGD